jgi:hypothetical protein
MNMEENHVDRLSIFEAPPTDTAIQSREWIEYRPNNQITDYAALEFNVPPQSTGYMDLKRSLIKIKCRIITESGTPIGSDEKTPNKVALVNLALHSIFAQVDCMFQQTHVSQLGTNYPYKAYLDTILCAPLDERVQLESQLYFKDDDQEDPDPAGRNQGLYNRSVFTIKGNIVDMEGPLYLDMFQQDRLVMNGVGLSLKFWPSKNPFRLLSSDENAGYKVEIVEASFKLCVQKPNPAVLMAHAKMFKSGPAIYPYIRSDLKIASIPTGQFSYTAEDMFQGEVPSQLILGLVSSASYTGDYKRSPFDFKPFDCNFVALYVDGHSVPARPLQPNFAHNTYVEAYRTLDTFRRNTTISREDYKSEGYTLYVLNIDQHVDFNTKRKGHCRLELRFTTALPESVTLLMYGKFPNFLHIDESRSIILR